MAKAGVPMNVIQAALGHASLATTNVYLRGLAPVDVFDAMRSLPSALTAAVEELIGVC